MSITSEVLDFDGRDEVTKVDVSARRFRPNENMLAFVATFEDFSIPRTKTARAEAIGLTRQAVHKWEQKPGFEEWLSTERRKLFGRAIEDVKEKCLELALKGSIDHIRIVLELAGELPGRGGHAGERARGEVTTVVINVPRPDPEHRIIDVDGVARPALPPGRED